MPQAAKWGWTHTHTKSIIFASEKNQSNKFKNIAIKMLKDVGMTMPKSRETSAVYMQQDRGCNNNTKIKDVGRIMIVACPHPLSFCIYTALVSLLFGTVIPYLHFHVNLHFIPVRCNEAQLHTIILSSKYKNFRGAVVSY